jgi:chemotaxis protein CheD
MNSTRVHVKIGELRVLTHEGVLFSVGLGSCVAVALYDPHQKVAGLAHVMLPDPKEASEGFPGRFAPTAVTLLIDMMAQAGADKRHLHARVVGGAAMFADVIPNDTRLGERNVTAVKTALANASIPLRGEDVGGSFGRSVYLDAKDGSLLVRAVRRDDVTL